MQLLDSSHYWKITLVLLLYRFLYVFFYVTRYIIVAIPLLGYIPAMISLRDDGARAKLLFPALVIDFLLLIFFPIILLFDLFHFAILTLFILILYITSKKEINLFGRTIASLNPSERKKARKALKTMDPKEITEVAIYREWSSI